MTSLLRNFDLIVDSFPVGASHSLCYTCVRMFPYFFVVSQNVRSSLLETLDPHIKESGNSYMSVGIAMSQLMSPLAVTFIRLWIVTEK